MYHTGYNNSENKTSLTNLHKLWRPEIKLKKFIQNISAVTILGSYYIFNDRKHLNWSEEAIISAPFNNN